jgi:hypothetical protein
MCEGDVTQILHILSKNHGVNNNISLGILGVILRDPVTMLDSVCKLSQEWGVNTEFNLLLAGAFLDINFGKKSYPNLYLEQENISQPLKPYLVIRPLSKKLTQLIFPNFPVTSLDKCHDVLIESNLQSFEYIWENLGVPKELFKIGVDLMFGDKINLIDSVWEFKNFLCKQNGVNPSIFDSLNALRSAQSEYSIDQLKNSIDQLKNSIDSKHTLKSFLLQFAIAAFKGNKCLIKSTIISKNSMR